MKKAFGAVLLVTGWVGIGLAQVTSTGVEPAPGYDTFQAPHTGATYSDPVFGSAIKRVSNAQATRNADRGGYLTWIENEYATMTPFNNDNSRFLLVHESYFGLYDGDGTYLYDLPLEINSSSEPRWSRHDNSLLYYHSGNHLKSYNVATSATSVVHTFTEYQSIYGSGEMDISEDGDHLVFAGDSRYIFVYQISKDKVLGTLDAGGRPFDALYITPNNNVIVAWGPSGTARYTGQELFNSQMKFQRQVGRADGHKDVTRDTNGDELLIWTNSNDPTPIDNCQNGIVKIRLADAKQTCLLQLGWTLAVHISAPDHNGTVFVDTEAPANPEPGTSAWIPYTDELLQVKLDGSGTTRLAHHRSRPVNGYIWQPKISTSRDGTRLLYSSNYDMSNIAGYPTDYADVYMVTVAPTGAAPATTPITTPTTPITSSTTSSVVRVEQGDAAVQHTGTWYPNGGAFNSGGSAVMAMDDGATTTLTFTGTGVKWIGFGDGWSGIAEVYLDGVLAATVDTYSASEAAQATHYSADNLTNGVHTLAIVAKGNHSGTSAGSWVWVDAFDVTVEAPVQNAAKVSSVAPVRPRR